ncbi:hypothetical protein IJH29_01780 [Candidatus Saccharibacteria bacterium]|nr:hypothetical protein [Candidatus Saccharibacteria bacterium]
MDTAEWIIVSILSLTLFVFLILGIYVLTKVLDLTHDIKHVVRQVDSITKQGKKIMGKAEGTVDSVKSDVTATTGAVKDAVVSALNHKFNSSQTNDKAPKAAKK